MNYRDYCEQIKNVEAPSEMEFHVAIMWPNQARLPVGLVTIGDKNLKVIKIPEMIENKYKNIVPVIAISNIAFAGNEQVTDIILPSDISRLPARAFAGCTNLKNVTIPRNVRLIKEGTFAGCVNLENIYYEGTPAEWKDIEIVHSKHEIEFGQLKPGTPVQSIVSEKDIYLPGNEAIFSANIHYRCELASSDMSFQITVGGKDATDDFRMRGMVTNGR